jgi:hypothetical protein
VDLRLPGQSGRAGLADFGSVARKQRNFNFRLTTRATLLQALRILINK